ncbi:Glutathione peroxidase homolog BsaA [Sphingobacterium spiritivorum]|uniref:Glutathione peroxidase n=1 Tax=Sphingobacterium spiritivorum TaxID=258 RepID=A0A380BRK1_SPHSI|nr:glutathione peroxidase [Sphingobacterium spiritivorum]SUJ04615.1 Glutathione peroxidase homolog BsaA [Sphingobacterium spiritivorum]
MILMTLMVCMSMITNTPTVYDYSFKDMEGKTVNLSDYKGKKILIVNTASKCGFTKQYKDLQALSEQYGDKVVVIGFPANNFGGQEPGSNEEIQDFCEKNFGVTFTLSEKVEVKGDQIDPLFKFLTNQENPDFKGEIKWNFEKFLIDENGKLIHRYRSAVNPLDKSITTQL